EHQRDAGRDDDADGAGGGLEGGGGAGGEAGADHRRHHDDADGGDGGGGRAADGGEGHGRDDGDDRQPAAEVADEGAGELDEPLGHPAAPHDPPGEDEQRDGEQGEAVALPEELLRDQAEPVLPAAREDRRGGREHERHRYRDGEDEQREERGEEGGDHAAASRAAASG